MIGAAVVAGRGERVVVGLAGGGAPVCGMAEVVEAGVVDGLPPGEDAVGGRVLRC